MEGNTPITISAICVLDKNNGIGWRNTLPWRIPEDSKRFRRLTEGHVVIGGRRTYESIGGPLVKRINIVVSRHMPLDSGFHVARTVDEALDLAVVIARRENQSEVFVIGGEQIYRQVLARCTRLYLTLVDGTYPTDTVFPDYADFVTVIDKEARPGSPSYTYLTLER
jgi:dihydrofolate reductase